MLTALIITTAIPIVYVYALYPAALLAIAHFLRNRSTDRRSGPIASISLVIPAYNEERVIASKVRNSLGLDYPREKLEIVVASDGSTDATGREALAAGSPPLRLVEFPNRRGKTVVLNEVVPTLSGEIVVQSDANSELAPEALREIAAPFADPSIGCVVGQLVLTNRGDPRVLSGEGLYWSYENRLKTAESRLGALITANGGLYAYRKALFTPLPAHIAGDAADPLLIASKGWRVVFAPRAIAREKAVESLREEYRRKVRIMTQGLATWVYVRGMMAPFRPRLALALFSHKLLRWLLPWFLTALQALCLAPGAPGWARAFGVTQMGFYALALIGLAGGARIRKIWPIGVAAYFCMANAAAMVATLKLASGRRYPTWERSASSR